MLQTNRKKKTLETKSQMVHDLKLVDRDPKIITYLMTYIK